MSASNPSGPKRRKSFGRCWISPKVAQCCGTHTAARTAPIPRGKREENEENARGVRQRERAHARRADQSVPHQLHAVAATVDMIFSDKRKKDKGGMLIADGVGLGKSATLFAIVAFLGQVREWQRSQEELAIGAPSAEERSTANMTKPIPTLFRDGECFGTTLHMGHHSWPCSWRYSCPSVRGGGGCHAHGLYSCPRAWGVALHVGAICAHAHRSTPWALFVAGVQITNTPSPLQKHTPECSWVMDRFRTYPVCCCYPTASSSNRPRTESLPEMGLTIHPSHTPPSGRGECHTENKLSVFAPA